MSPIRILLVDDSVVVRRMVARVLDSEEGLQVAGTAPNGKVALAKIPELAPDVVVLDVEMPVMDGLETLRRLRQQHPALPVVMFSSLTERGAETTLEALERGADDYVAKPGGTQGMAGTQEHIREELAPKVRALGAASSGLPARSKRSKRSKRTASATRATAPTAPAAGVDVVAIGASTGGPNALMQLLPALPADFPVPVVVVQHMPPVFTKSLAKRLDRKSALDVQEGTDGDIVEPGGVWVAPGDAHMELARAGTAVRLHMHEGPPENSCRPAADVLFRSVPAVYGARALGVVLTGMGKDGLRGAEHIVEAGGRVLAQDEASSVVWGMPGMLAQAGLPEAVLPLGSIAGELQRRVAGADVQKRALAS